MDANAPTDSVAADQGPIPDAMMPIDTAIVPDANVIDQAWQEPVLISWVQRAMASIRAAARRANGVVRRGGQFIHEDIGLPCDCRVRRSR